RTLHYFPTRRSSDLSEKAGGPTAGIGPPACNCDWNAPVAYSQTALASGSAICFTALVRSRKNKTKIARDAKTPRHGTVQNADQLDRKSTRLNSSHEW